VFENINVWVIVKDHLKTLKVYRSDKTSTEDVILFLVIPFLGALSLVLFLDYRLDVDAINALITSLSVFSGLLFNLLLLIYDLLRKENTKDDSKEISEEVSSSLRRTFLSHIYAHISFTILTAVLSITLLLFLFIKINFPILTISINVAVIFLIINFILTMLMILQRVHILISTETT
jgi:amino acid transporter